MRSPRCSDDVIDALVQFTCGETASNRAKHVYREALRHLVRLAKAERTREMQMELKHSRAQQDEHILH